MLNASPRDESEQFIAVANENMVGTTILIFAKVPVAPLITNIKVGNLARGIGGVLGNKGGVAVRCDIYDSSGDLLTHSLTGLLTHSPAYSLAYSLTGLLTHSYLLTLTYSLTHWLTHLLTHSLTHSLSHSLTHSLTHLLTYSPTHLLNHSLSH